MAVNKQTVDKNSREYLTQKRNSGRSTLLTILIFTVINIVMLVVQADYYFLFSASVPYYLTLFGMIFDEFVVGTYTTSALVIAAVILGLFLLCWIFSKKRRGWLIAALVMFIIDTVLVIVDAIGFMEISYLMDIAFHIWLIVELILGIRVGKEAIAEMNAPAEAVEDTAFFDASIDEKPNTPCLGEPQSERKYRLIVQAQHGGRTIEVRRSYGLTELVIDGRLYGVWEGRSESAYESVARVDGHEIATRFLPTGKQTIEVDGEMIAKKQRLF